MLDNCLRLKPIERINPQMTSNDSCINRSGGCGSLICSSNSPQAYYSMDCSLTTLWQNTSYPTMPLTIGWLSGDKDRTYTLDNILLQISQLNKAPTKIKIYGGRGELNNVVWSDILEVSLLWSEEKEKKEIEINNEIPYHSYKIEIIETNNSANSVNIIDLGFYGKNKYCLEREPFEELANADFDCGTLSWETSGGTLVDVGNSLTFFRVFNTDGSLTHKQVLDLDVTKEYFLNVLITVSSGNGVIRMYKKDNSYIESAFLPAIKEYQMFCDNVDRVEILANNDLAFQVILDRISLQEINSNDAISDNGDIVSLDGEILVCKN